MIGYADPGQNPSDVRFGGSVGFGGGVWAGQRHGRHYGEDLVVMAGIRDAEMPGAESDGSHADNLATRTNNVGEPERSMTGWQALRTSG